MKNLKKVDNADWTYHCMVDMTLIDDGIKLDARGFTARIGMDGGDLPDVNKAYFPGIADALPPCLPLGEFMEAIDRPLRQEADLRHVLASAARYYHALADLSGTVIISARLRLDFRAYDVSEEKYEIGDFWRAAQESITITNTPGIVF